MTEPDITNITDAQGRNGSFDQELTFESFVVGEANQLACQAARMVSDTPLNFCNPLLICGGIGQGKTHLMHAIGNRIISRNPQTKIRYTTSEAFTNEYIQALQSNAVMDFRKMHRKVDILLIEDLQHFFGKSHLQREFFHTIVALLKKRIQVVITLNQSPVETAGFEPELNSLLQAGLTVQIESPDINLIKAILYKKAEQLRPLGVSIGPEEVEKIALNHPDEPDVRKLIGNLSHIAFQSWLAGQAKESVHSAP